MPASEGIGLKYPVLEPQGNWGEFCGEKYLGMAIILLEVYIERTKSSFNLEYILFYLLTFLGDFSNCFC